MSMFAQVIDPSDARMCKLQNASSDTNRELKKFRGGKWLYRPCALDNQSVTRADWLVTDLKEEDIVLIFGPVDVNELFTEAQFRTEHERAKERNDMLQEVWRYRSRIVPTWLQLARKGNLPDSVLNIIGSFLTVYISNEEHPLPRVQYRASS